MKIRLIIVGFCLFTVGAWAAQLSQSSKNKTPRPEKESPPAVTFIDNEQTAQAPNEANDNPRTFYAALKKPDWWLVAVAALTFVAIWRQAIEMGKATERRLESTHLSPCRLMSLIRPIWN